MAHPPGVEISKQLVVINTLSSIVTRLLSLTVLVWLNQYLIVRLDTAEYSLYPVILAVSLFAQIFTSVFTGGIARYSTEAYAKGDMHRVTEIVSSMVPPLSIGTAVFLGLGGLACWKVDTILTIGSEHVREAQLMLGLLLLNQGIRLLVTPYLVGLHISQKFIWLNLIQLGQELVRIALLFLLLFGVSTKVLWVVVATVAAALLATLVTFFLSRRLVPELRFRRSAYRKDLVRELTSFGSWTMVGLLAWRVKMSSDVIVLNKLGTPTDVTAFHVGTMVDRQVDGFMAIASTTLGPPLTAMHATDQQDALSRAYLRGNRVALWMALAVAVPLAVFAEQLVVLYVGSEFIAAATVALLIYGLYPISYSAELLHSIAIATARVRAFMLLTIIAAIVKIALSIVFVGSLGLGAMGAALSTAITIFVGNVFFCWPMGVRMVGITFGRYVRETLVPGLMPAVVAAAACLALLVALPPTTWLRMGIDTGIGLVVYALVVLMCFREADREDVAQLWQRLRGARDAAGKRG